MPKPGRPRKLKATEALVVPTPELEVDIRELTLEDQHEKRTDIMIQMKDDLWYERQSDSAMARQFLMKMGFNCPSHSLHAVLQVIKAVEIDHEIGVAADERAEYQRSLRWRGWCIYEQFGIEYLTQPTCEWARFQSWCKQEFIRFSLSFSKQEISGQEYIEEVKKVYKKMNDFQASYWDKLRQDRLEFEYQKWLSTVRKSVKEQELPVNMVWDIEAGEVMLSAPEATSAETIRRFMEDECHLPEGNASHTQQWIALKVGSSKLIFGLSPEHRGLLPPPQTPPPSEGSDTEPNTHGALNEGGNEGEVSEEGLSPANIPPSASIIPGGLSSSKQLAAKKRFNAKRLPPLPHKEPWILEWDNMTDAQKARMRDIHFGQNDEYHRPPRRSAPAPNNPHTPVNASKNPVDLDQEDQNNDLIKHQDRDGATTAAETSSETSEELELSNQTETATLQQGQQEAAAARSSKDSQSMEKSDSAPSEAPLMIGHNRNSDDGSKHPSQSDGIPSKRHYKQKTVVVDDYDDDSTALDDVEDKWLDPEVEARVMGNLSSASPRRTHSERCPGSPGKNQYQGNDNTSSKSPEIAAAKSVAAQPITEPEAQSAGVRETALFRTPIVPALEASRLSPGLPQRGTFSDTPNSDILRQQHKNAPQSGDTYTADARLNVSSRVDPRLGSIDRPRIERPRIGPRPGNMNQKLYEAVRRASKTPASSSNEFVPVNRPVAHGQPSGTPNYQSTSPVSAPPRPRADEQATAILVRNIDGALTPASSSLKRRRSQGNQNDEGFRQRRFTSNGNHLNQQVSSPENFGIHTRHSRSASTSSIQRPGVPMMPQTSHPGFNNTSLHPQKQVQMNGIMAPMQHGDFSQRRQTQSFEYQARGNSYQSPNMIDHVSSMNCTGPSGNSGAAATQIQSLQPGSNGYLGMMTSQQKPYTGHTSPQNGYDVGKYPIPNGNSGHRGSQLFQQPNTMNGPGWPNAPNHMDPFASPHAQNSTNGFGLAQASPNMSNSAHGAFGQQSHGYGMAQSSQDMHNVMRGNLMAQPTSGLRRHRPSMENSQHGRPTGMRHMRQDQRNYNGPMRTSNTAHSDMQLNGSVEASQMPRYVNGQIYNGKLPPSGSRRQPGDATSHVQQNAQTTVGQPASADASQRQKGPQTIATTNGRPNEKRRRPGRPRRSPPQHSQPQSQYLAPAPAPQTQPASPRPWTADQSVYSNRPVKTAHGPLYFGNPPTVLRHVPPPPQGPPPGTGSLQNIEPVEQNYTYPNMHARTTAILEHQLGVARDLGLSLQPPPAAPANPQPNMNNPAAILARKQQAPQQEQVPQEKSAAANPFIDPSSMSLSLAPAAQDDVLPPKYVPTAPGEAAKQEAQNRGHESYGDGMGLDDWDHLITPLITLSGSHLSSQLEFPESEGLGNIYVDPANDPFGGVNFDEFRENICRS